MLTQTPKPSAQAVVWAMKQQRESTATMVRNVEAPHQHLSVWRDASKMKLKILEWEALDSGPVEPRLDSRGLLRNENVNVSEVERQTNNLITRKFYDWMCTHVCPQPNRWSNHPPFVCNICTWRNGKLVRPSALCLQRLYVELWFVL